MPPRSITNGPSHHVWGEIVARLDGLSSLVEGTRNDTREARDISLKLKEHLETLDIPKQLAEERKDREAGDRALRADLVNSADKIRSDVRDIDQRLKVLEDARKRFQGASGLLGWLSRHAPWLFAAVIYGADILHLRPRLP